MVLNPRRVVRVLVEVLGRDVMMLAVDHPADASQKALRSVVAGAVDAVSDLAIDTARLVLGLQRVPMAGFVGVQFRARRNDLVTLPGLPKQAIDFIG